MLRENLTRYLTVTKKNYWFSTGLNVLMAMLLLVLIPILFGINDLDGRETAKVLEQFVTLIGIILLTPIFRPEQQKDIREVVEAKYTSQTGIYLIRILTASLLILLFITSFIGWMRINHCSFPVKDYIFGTLSTSLLLGSMGLLTYAISDQIILGYMLPIGYFIFNLFTGDRYVKKFYIFSMTKGSFEEKYWLLGAAAMMVFGTLFIKWIQRRVR